MNQDYDRFFIKVRISYNPLTENDYICTCKGGRCEASKQ